MNAHTQALPFDAEALTGLSAQLINSHHQNNYGGAVKRLNAIREQLAGTAFATAPGFQLNGIKREELIATHSMLLHELYFDSLGGDGVLMTPACTLALCANFGSVERWREEFTACAKALGGGSGWMLLVFQPRDGSLVNQWAADHTHAGWGRAHLGAGHVSTRLPLGLWGPGGSLCRCIHGQHPLDSGLCSLPARGARSK